MNASIVKLKGFKMATALKQPASLKNQILRGLPKEKYEGLFSNLRVTNLTARQVLYHVGDAIPCAYFINDGITSLLSITPEGESIEVASVGREGVVGIPVILRHAQTPHQIVVQVPGEAMVISAHLLREEFEKEGELRDRLLSYTHAFATCMSQIGVCNHFHTLDKRLCRWLLITSDKVESQSFHLTHEALSQVLGTGRAGVTMVANKLQKQGLIHYHRGEITILNRAGLEEISCECYEITKDVFEPSPGL